MRALTVGFATLALALACAGPEPKAVLGVAAHDLNDSCSGIFDFCVQMTCTIENKGDGPGPGKVTFVLEQPDGSKVTGPTETIYLGPGERQTLSHDFKEAKLLDADKTIARCMVE